MRHLTIYLFALFFLPAMAFAQETKDSVITIDGEIVTARVENGDTLILAELTEVSITTMKDFSSNADYYRYQKYRRYASVVYPYAVRSIQLFREVQDETEGLKKRKARKHIRQLNRDVKEEFTDPLKDLNRTQGLILIKMIENAIDTPLYEVLKELRGGFNAMKWQTVGKLYGYDLREGYIKGEDRILDIVLEDYDLKPYFQ